MKYFNRVRQFAAIIFASSAFIACDKVEVPEPLGDQGQKIVGFVGVGGLSNFTASALILNPASSSATVNIQLELKAPKVYDQDLTVTFAYDEAALTAYNATVSNPADRYFKLPDNMYSLPSTSVVIKAGQSLSEVIPFTLYPTLFDPALNYMLPLTITSISGGSSDIKKAIGTGTAYFHIIGNPLAGTYSSTGWFYHPTPASHRAINEEKLLSPSSSTVLLVDLGDLGPQGYRATLQVNASNQVAIAAAPGATGAPYTVFTEGLPSSNPGYTAGWANSASCNNTYDPDTKTFYLRYGYMGGTGWRVTEEILEKQ